MPEHSENETAPTVPLTPSLDRRPAPRIVRSLLTVALPTLLCASLLFMVGHDAGGSFLGSGSRSYALVAENIATAGFYSLDGENPTAFRPPAYPLFLTAAMALGGSDWTMVALLGQGAAAAACLALTALIAHHLFANPLVTASSLALVAANVSMMKAFFVLHETGLFVLLTLLYVLLVLIPLRQGARAALLGVVTALALLTRPSGIVFLPVSGLVLACLAGLSPPRLLRTFTAYAVALSVCVAPWQLHLYRSFGRLSLTGTSTSGMNLFKGNHPLMGEIYNLTDVDRANPLIADLVAKAGLSWRREEWQANDHLLRLAREAIAEDPMRFVRRVVEKAIAFLSPAGVPIGQHGEVYLRDGTLVVREAEVVVGGARVLYHLFVIPLGLLGLAAAILLPGRRLWGLCAGALVVGTMLIYALTFPERRYRFALEPLLAIAAVGFVHGSFAPRLAQRFERRRARQPRQSGGPVPTDTGFRDW